MNDKKIKILFHSNFHKAYTGFGKNAKNILLYLYKTNKYDIIEAANGINYSESGATLAPWKVYGTVPNDQNLINKVKNDPVKSRDIAYGSFCIDKIIEKEKPNVYIGVEDIWAFDSIINRPWWNKIPCMIWTTLDSLPLLPSAIEADKLINNYYVWSSFAEKEAERINLKNIKTLHGAVNIKNFFKLSDHKRSILRENNKIDQNSFIVGFVFRNQLRKTVGDLIKALSVLNKIIPDKNIKILLHTSWSEGWDIPRLIKEHSANPSNVLTTYHCNKCKNYTVKSFHGEGSDCPFCKSKKSFFTTNPKNGISETQLNEIYNLMDMYVHPFTSGGQELPIQEAKLTELITAVTNYTCGSEMCSEESGGIPLSWSEYREIGTQFIKASTSVDSIVESIKRVLFMSEEEKNLLQKKSRNYIVENYSIDVIGKKLESIIDSMNITDYSFDSSPNLQFEPRAQYESGEECLKDICFNLLKIPFDKKSEDCQNIQKLLQSQPLDQAINIIKNSAISNSEEFDSDLKNDKNNKKIAIVIPPNDFICLISKFLLENIHKKFPNHLLYIICSEESKSILYDCDFVYKFVKYNGKLDNPILLEDIYNFDYAFTFNNDYFNHQAYSHDCKES